MERHVRTAVTAPLALALLLWPACAAAADAASHAVAVVASDDAQLPRPAARTDSLDAEQIVAMVRRAVDLVGGMGAYVPAAARTVLLKPNLVAGKPPGSGTDTDPRVVRAVALLVHEAAPAARLLIAEGSGGWMSPALKDCTDVEPFPERLFDGFETSGYRQVVAELRGRGLDIDCYDLNFDRTRTLAVPGGGLARDEYDLPIAILDADAWINIPVAKTHGTKITCCMKNQFGLLPGRLYGWSKSQGTKDHPGMPHAPAIVDECWVDLWLLTQMDLNVVDLIRGTEAGAFAGEPRRSNAIVVGPDPIATDLVVAQIMGFNPDDFEFADLARQRGLGPGAIEGVDRRGRDPADLVTRYKKAGVEYAMGEWGEHAEYGMGARRWTLLGPLPADHGFTPEQRTALAPTPGQEGWSSVVFFGHDRIDLDKHFDDPVDCAVYAFTRFAMPQADSVRFWAGSDEDLAVWIDGAPVYAHEGRRPHRLGGDKGRGWLAAGEHRLLVRAGQRRGGFEFSFNICEPLDDRLYAGNTYPGLRYYVTRATATAAAAHVAGDDAGGEFGPAGEPFHESTLGAADPLEAWRTAPPTVSLDVGAPAHADLVGLLLERARPAGDRPDSLTTACLERLPFGLCYLGLRNQVWAPYFAYGPEPTRVLRWLGLRYGITHGAGPREALKSVQGWLAGGYVPAIGVGGSWALAAGYRPGADGVELHIVSPQTSAWGPPPPDWQGIAPGGQGLSAPVVVAQAGAAPTARALVDSLAAVALEMARRERFVLDERDWGQSCLPAGLAAWDAWVIDWERRPWTPTWAREPATRAALAGLGTRYLSDLADGRALAGAFFAAAAQAFDLPELTAAGAAYAESARCLRALVERLPQGPAGADGDDDAPRLEEIAAAAPLLRQARAAERAAAAALARHLGDGASLRAAAEDPLRHRDRGHRLLTWHTDYNQGVYDVTVRGDSLAYALRDGRACEGLTWQVVGAVPREAGWTVAVEVERGDYFYDIVQQPAAANGWTWVLRLDERFNRGGDPTQLVVWAVPQVEE